MYEIDYLWVGEKSNTGDAIACRFTRPDTGGPAVVIIDGGFQETGVRLAEHVQSYYGTSTVDLVVCTHPDDDHIAGLSEVVEQLDVSRLLIHRPARYGYDANDDVKAERVEELVGLAQSRGVVIDDSFYAGASYFDGALQLAGPSEAYYQQLLAEQQTIAASVLSRAAHAAPRVGASLIRGVKSLLGDPGETMTGDNGGTTPRNNSSLVLDLQVDGKRVLFTGDAGAPALERAADQLDGTGRSAAAIDLFHVPHHGSRHNLTPELLDRLLGGWTEQPRGYAIASVGKEADGHPRPEVANAIKRRGYPVCCTRGSSLWWRSADAPSRWQYTTSVQPLGWLDERAASAA